MDIKTLELQFVDSLGKTVLKTKLISLPIKENIILSKSMECFQDPEPCMIHRSAVVKTFYMELYEYITGVLDGNNISTQRIQIPETLMAVIDIQPDISTVLLRT